MFSIYSSTHKFKIMTAAIECHQLSEKQYLNKPVVTFMAYSAPLKRAFEALGWEVTEEENSEKFNYCWARPVAYDQLARLTYGQMINQMPGQACITRKDLMAVVLQEFGRKYPKVMTFLPLSFVIPQQSLNLQLYMESHKQEFFIYKPALLDRGEGIQIYRGIQFNKIDKYEQALVQSYVPRPYLINGYKFDFRIYVLVLQIDPLVVYVYKDGIVRFATTKYSVLQGQAQIDPTQHLTNYSLNKEGVKTAVQEGNTQQFKQTYTDVLAQLPADLAESVDHQIKNAIKAIFIAAEPTLSQHAATQGTNCYPRKTCGFYGLDFLLAEDGNINLLEVNANPSTNTDTPADRLVKRPMFQELVTLTAPKKFIIKQKIKVPTLAPDGDQGDKKYTKNPSQKLSQLRAIWEVKDKKKTKVVVQELFNGLSDFEQKVIKQLRVDQKKAQGFVRLIPGKDIEYMTYFDSAKYMDYLVAILTYFDFL